VAEAGLRQDVPDAVLDFIRNTLNVPTIAVGNIYEPDHVNSIVASGRADLCAVARPHLANPNWTLQAAAQLQHFRTVVAAAVSVGQESARTQSAACGAARGRSMSSLQGEHAVVTVRVAASALQSRAPLAAQGAKLTSSGAIANRSTSSQLS
jgi:tRNA-dihydrouridine synthase